MSDEEVIMAVHQQFRDTAYRHLKRIVCTIEPMEKKRCLVLRGEVPTFFMKQMAQVLIIGKINGYEIRNLIEVKFSDF